MTFWRHLGLTDAAAAVLAILFLFFGAGAWSIFQPVPEIVTDAVVEEPVVEPEAPAAVVVAEIAEVVEPEVIPDEEVVIAEPVTVQPLAPKLDIVRVSADGDAVVAGTADPGATIAFLVNGVQLFETQADVLGNFVGLFDIPASDTPNAITVASVSKSGELISDEAVLVAAVRLPEPEPDSVSKSGPEVVVEPDTPIIAEVENVEVSDEGVASVVPQEETPIETVVPEVVAQALTEAAPENEEPLVVASATPEVAPEVEPAPLVEVAEAIVADVIETPQSVSTPVTIQDDVAVIASVGTTSEAAPKVANSIKIADEVTAPTPKPSPTTAPTIVVAGANGVRVLQPAQQPEAPTSVGVANVVIDTISYDTEGDVALEGRGRSDGFVRVYLNDQPVLTIPVEKDGSWSTPLVDIDAGVYRLRVDEITADGDVTSRVETPFQREEVEIAADAPPTAVTVQPGSTLWAIARDRFGAGAEYVRVYEANRDLIRDPDLIYPGQVFALPDD